MDKSQLMDFQPLRSAEKPLPTTPRLQSSISQSMAHHALNRLGFGPRPGEVAAFEALGATDTERLTAWLDQQLDPASIDDSACATSIANANLETANKTIPELWQEYVRDPLDQTLPYQPVRDQERLTLMQTIHSKRQLLEIMVDFWHNHFNVHGYQNIVQSTIISYDRDVIRVHALGNFRVMLEAVAQHVSMLYYLDNYTNASAGPNENYARELFELHTMGIDGYLGSGTRQFEVPRDANNIPIGYVDDDVYEATRCFTGWTVNNTSNLGDTGEFQYRSDLHDRFQKFVLGEFIPANQPALYDGQRVLDQLATHPKTAIHIARKLCIRLVSDAPPQTIIDSAAAVFTAQQEADDQIAQVVRHIVLSAEFATAKGVKIKRPLEFFVSALRALEIDFSFAYSNTHFNTFINLYNAMGQRLSDWAAPNGYPDSADFWLNTTFFNAAWRSLNWLLTLTETDGSFVYPMLDVLPASVRSATALVDFWVDRLLDCSLSTTDRQTLIDLMSQGFNPDFDLPVDTDLLTEYRLRVLLVTIFVVPSVLYR